MSTGTSSIGSNASALKSASSLTTAASGVLSKAEKDRKTIAQNFDAFLGLLTTQLKNQSPLDPLDANQFTQQLVQFSSVEQQLKTNDLLTAMAKNIGGAGGGAGNFNAANAAALIGTQVSVDGGTQRLSEDGSGGYSAAFPVKAQANYSNYQVSITNAAGQEVYRSGWTPPGNGDQVFTWNGRRGDGVLVDPTDKYTISVVGDLTGTSQKSRMATERAGVVTAVDLSGVEPMVQFGGLSLPLSQIKKVSKVNV
jgi:flagellar basal-body rod modification protein FlgD